ncbi:MAG: DUF2069 domain-containing protein [Halomonas sp.]|jgi:uncharacterized membrane protein|uniref:DUF2069 domain-containing protein n=1 Tax=Billgrantia tianxiuensis TaxID=2497861 RepID=A0A6I6SKR6_9GAMM|nr:MULTISPECIES: DUF2069 domain-containing protein [Halomonas]MCE8031740.1 DUF2069 domain-containing protein [Halomonas sp. MCCC 1A11057]MDX5433590.1 DUF2069 domain-containing protein [Halomonas sp.]QHC50142.1 DUF2069 domain-containing protein [Halomonas tianxiuensis]
MRRWVEGLEERHGLGFLTERSRQLVLTSYVVLLLLLVWSGLAMQAGTNPLTPILIRALPLILFLPSIMAKRPRGHAWLAFVSLLYFIQGVMVATLPGQGILGVVEALAALALFTGCMFYARFRSRQLKAERGE